MDPLSFARLDLHPVRILSWAAILLWLVFTLFLADYYLTTNNLVSAHLWGFSPSSTHARISSEDASSLGFGLTPAPTVEQAEQSLPRLMSLRNTSKNGQPAALSSQLTSLRDWVSSSSSEQLRMGWAPVFSCIQTGCDNPTYIVTAGRLASAQPMLASNAMAIESAYWYEAQKAHDLPAAARAIARLDLLVHKYGSADLQIRWDKLQQCNGACPLFEEQLLDFIAEAGKL